jgi:hypothetical protein
MLEKGQGHAMLDIHYDDKLDLSMGGREDRGATPG